MSFKVVHAFAMPGVNLGEDCLKDLDVTYEKGLWLSEEELIGHGRDADAILAVPSFHPLTRGVLAALERCRIVAGIGIGFDAADLEAATEFGIAITNVPDYCLDEVSSHALALVLALDRKLMQLDKAIRSRPLNLTKDRGALMEVAFPVFRMRDLTLGIVGLGKIGTSTALKARGLGMRVIAYDPYVLGPVMESRGVHPVDLPTLLKESDFVSIHTPLNEETRGLIGYGEFKQMKPTCYLINTARGGCVEQQGLVRALKEGLIAGAGLDVTVDEPIAMDNPLLQMPNVILTGHSAYYSTSSEVDLYSRPMTQVVHALRGQFPPYAVNPEVKRFWLEKWGRPTGAR
jgi:D-3-phosphoglycerate dehydrogenase / 2-oxoglutarate reductase